MKEDIAYSFHTLNSALRDDMKTFVDEKSQLSFIQTASQSNLLAENSLQNASRIAHSSSILSLSISVNFFVSAFENLFASLSQTSFQITQKH